jgi:hypothetical protein
MRFKFRNYFYQNEESGADSTDGVSSGSATDEVKAPAKPEEDDTVKRTLKKLRDELNAAQALVKQKDEQLKEKERLDEEERAKRTGDFAKLKEQLLTETAAEKAAAKKREEEALQRLEEKDAKVKQQFIKKEIKAAFAQVFRSEFLDDLTNNPAYAKQLEAIENEDGEYEVIVVESVKDRTQRFKVVDKKTVPFTIEDWANEIAAKKPSAAKPLNRASGDNIPNGSGKRQTSDFNRTADPMDLVKKGLGLS